MVGMNNLYSKRFIKAISFFSIICSIFLTIRTGYRIFDIVKNPNDFFIMDSKQQFKYYFIICKNIIFIGLYIFLIFNPQKFIIIGITALLYATDNLLGTVQSSFMGIPMFTLCIGTFAFRGFFINHKKTKICIFIIFYLFCLIIPIFYDQDFLEHLFTKVAITLVTLISFVFPLEYSRQKGTRQATITKVLNIASFKGLERSDMYLLQEILNNKKYKEIAQSIHGSEGALRNKLSKIYKILEVGDRTGFITIYSGYKLIYEPELSESAKDLPLHQANHSC